MKQNRYGEGGTRGRRMALPAEELVGKLYDPESRRQRRLGMAEAGLAGLGAAGLIRGGKGIRDTTRAVRRVQGVTGSKDYAKDVYLARDTLKSRKAIVANRKDAALAGGGAASLAGAAIVRQHAEGRRGRRWD